MQKKHVMAVISCIVTVLIVLLIGGALRISTSGFGFIVLQLILWIVIIPKVWKWAVVKFDDK